MKIRGGYILRCLWISSLFMLLIATAWFAIRLFQEPPAQAQHAQAQTPPTALNCFRAKVTPCPGKTSSPTQTYEEQFAGSVYQGDASTLVTTPFIEPGPAGPKLAILIDDMGQSTQFAGSLIHLGYPVSFAILPHLTNSERVAQLAIKNHVDILLHQPMEPLGYPKISPGKGALFANMAPEKVVTILNANLDSLPGITGINNHMGSRFTQSRAGMATVAEVLKQRHLFFLDSLTSPKSVAAGVAKQHGLPVFRRNIFLDNAISEPAIYRQLKSAERLALRQGQAIAIGHPHSATLAALRRFAQNRDTRVTLVSIHQLTPDLKE